MAKKERPCRVCGQATLVKDVAEERTMYPSRDIEIMCVSCDKKRVAEAIRKTRKDLGLSERDSDAHRDSEVG